MRNGLVFIWSEKEILSDIIKCMEKKHLFYVESLVIAYLDPQKAVFKDMDKIIVENETHTETKQEYSFFFF